MVVIEGRFVGYGIATQLPGTGWLSYLLSHCEIDISHYLFMPAVFRVIQNIQTIIKLISVYFRLARLRATYCADSETAPRVDILCVSSGGGCQISPYRRFGKKINKCGNKVRFDFWPDADAFPFRLYGKDGVTRVGRFVPPLKYLG